MPPAMFLHVFLDGFLLISTPYRHRPPAYVAGISDLVEAFGLGITLLPDLLFLAASTASVQRQYSVSTVSVQHQ